MCIKKLSIYRIYGWMYGAKNECNTMITVPRWQKHTSSGANRSSNVVVTVNINAEFNLMPFNLIIQFFSRDLVTNHSQGLESDTVYTASHIFVETLPGHSNRSLSCLLLHMHLQAIIHAFLTWNVNIELCSPKAFTLTQLRL